MGARNRTDAIREWILENRMVERKIRVGVVTGFAAYKWARARAFFFLLTVGLRGYTLHHTAMHRVALRAWRGEATMVEGNLSDFRVRADVIRRVSGR